MEIIEPTETARSTYLIFDQIREKNFNIIDEKYSQVIKDIRKTDDVKIRKELMMSFLNEYLAYDIRLYILRVQCDTNLDWISCSGDTGSEWYIFFDFENLTYKQRGDEPVSIPDGYTSFSRYIY